MVRFGFINGTKVGYEENDGENEYKTHICMYNLYIYIFIYLINENILLQSHLAACISTSGTVVHDIHEKHTYIYT